MHSDKQPCRRLEFENESLTNSSVDDEITEGIHSKMSKESIPSVGMEFDNEDVAYEFYNAYALAVGFSVRKSQVHRQGRVVLDRTFVCHCQGKRGTDKRDNDYKTHQPETRFGCLARMKISCRQTGTYRTTIFEAKHNHSLASPRKAHLFRSHRNVTKAQASEVDIAYSSGIAPKNAYEFMAKQAGGRENLGFIHVDIKNYLRAKRSTSIRPGETGGVLEYMQRKKEEDPNFYYAIQVDEDDLITNIFWVDAVMRADFEDFGDVVCFDTTYRKYKDARPIALFVGVNHHRQTTIFGVALLYDETSDSFEWLFDTFFRAMGEKLPKTMLTDQDAAMAKALASQWPQTYHRLCIWHIFQNAATHLAHTFSTYKDFTKDFSNCIYAYEHEGEFLDAWNKMLEKYELENDAWLKRMFDIREKWAMVYGRDTFCADMTTTQRSESINKMIKHYVSYKDNLRRFFDNFERLLDDRRYDEMVADFKASQSRVVLAFPCQMLKHAASVYTPKVFKLFEAELSKALDCQLEICADPGLLVKYLIKPHDKDHKYVVCCDETENIIHCNCRMFEFAGLLCSHVLKVLCFRGLTQVHDKYVLKRWTKGAKKGASRGGGESLITEIDEKKAVGRRYRDLCRQSIRLVTRAAESKDGYNIVKEGLLSLFKNLELNSSKMSANSSSEGNHQEGNDIIHNIPINTNGVENAKGIKFKPKTGSQSSKRLQSALQIATRKNRKPKNKSQKYDLRSQTSDFSEQFAVGNHFNPIPGGVLQPPSSHVQLWEPTQYSLSMPWAYRQPASLSYQTNMQFPTQASIHFSQGSQSSMQFASQANIQLSQNGQNSMQFPAQGNTQFSHGQVDW